MKSELFFVINSLRGGGAERVLSTLANQFHLQKHRVKIICLNYDIPAYKVAEDLEIIYLLNRKGNNSIYRVYYAASIFFKLSYLLIANRPKQVVSFMTTANLWAGLTCLITGTNYIVSERTTPNHTLNSHRGLLKILSTHIYKKSKAIVSPSKGIENSLKLNKALSGFTNYKIINNPVFQFKVPTNHQVNDKKFILGVGRLSFVKGFDQLIVAFANAKIKDIDLLIIGEGVEYDILQQMIKSFHLEKSIKLLGHKSNLEDYYAQAELFVMPSRNEGYPNALMEAMSFGCACISMNCEFGPSEIIEQEENGLLVEDKNIQELSNAMNRVLDNPALKAKLSANAKKINKSNSLENIYLQWEELLFSI